jgi:hypothetical protein
MSKLRNMLFTSAHADKAKALLTLELLEKNPQQVLVIIQPKIFTKMLKKHLLC